MYYLICCIFIIYESLYFLNIVENTEIYLETYLDDLGQNKFGLQRKFESYRQKMVRKPYFCGLSYIIFYENSFW